METTREEARRSEPLGDQLDRQLGELLNELRVAMPGVQVLFAFLLTVPFQGNFERISAAQERLYFVALVLAALASAFFIAPTAQHRMLFGHGARPYLIKLGTFEALVGILCLGGAMMCSLALVTDVLFESLTVTLTVVPLGALYAYLWFGHALVRRIRGKASW